jgi:acyl-homoserine-lactone acylase
MLTNNVHFLPHGKRHIFRVLKRQLFKILPLILAFILVLVMANQSLSHTPKLTEVLWDTYGVPHIYGKDAQSAFKAFGWAQMQSHGNLLLRLYGQARGRAAQYWGEAYLESDRWVLTMGVPERARSWYTAQSSTFRKYIDAFAEGINAYAQEHQDLIADDVEVVLPVKAEDVLAHLQRVLNFTFVVNPDQLASISNQQPKAGSNGWAIAPSHSENGNAMLLANPHLPWSDPYLWYEAQIVAPGIDAYGAALVGVPVLAIAFNDHLGWTHTVNTFDGWDAYELKLVDNGYLFDGRVLPFETKTLSLKVKQPNGILHNQSLVVKSSVHGPIIIQKDGKAVALRVVGLDRPGVLQQWWDMARSKNLSQFQTALQQLQIPMFTVMYADREGHIMHLFNGQVPVRQKGDFKYWQGIIPGDISTTLWTKIHPYEDLPRVIDPPSGWLQNTNDPPWTTTFPRVLSPDNYPPYMAPRGPMSFRSQRSARMLSEDQNISFAEMVKYKHSTRSELADRLLHDLIGAARKYGDQSARKAADVLQAWDVSADRNSQGAVLFDFWVEQIDLKTVFKTPWNEKFPRTTPNGLADSLSAAKALSVAAAKVEKAYGKLDIAWGDVFRLQYGHVDLPANGGPDSLGVFRVVDYAPVDNQYFKSVAGDSYIAVIEFSHPVRAMGLTSYGNATQPGSRHVGDQLELFAHKQLRQIWRTRKEIQAHLEERKIF